jgi:hypothetical protein
MPRTPRSASSTPCGLSLSLRRRWSDEVFGAALDVHVDQVPALQAAARCLRLGLRQLPPPHLPLHRLVQRSRYPSRISVALISARSHNTVKGLFAWCQGCGHGGHLAHMRDWFAKHSTCPAGCGHACQTMRPVRPPPPPAPHAPPRQTPQSALATPSSTVSVPRSLSEAAV